MNLRDIKEEVCPHCGASPIVERIGYHHVNGHDLEYREFACGYSLEFVPNFMGTRVKNPCKNSDEIMNENKRKAAMKKEFVDYVNSRAVDLNASELEELVRHINSTFHNRY